jgi:hypothetical protein
MLSVIKDADGQTSAAVASSFTYKLQVHRLSRLREIVAGASGNSVADVLWPVQPSDVVAGALGVLPERVSTWEVVMRLKPGQVCMKPYMLKVPSHRRYLFPSNSHIAHTFLQINLKHLSPAQQRTT